jgi:hypothetical protein
MLRNVGEPCSTAGYIAVIVVVLPVLVGGCMHAYVREGRGRPAGVHRFQIDDIVCLHTAMNETLSSLCESLSTLCPVKQTGAGRCVAHEGHERNK